MAAKEKQAENKTLVLLDTHGLIHRAFHALPPLTSPAGAPVGAVYGVVNIVFKILREFQPDYIAAAFDRPEPTFRHEQYEDYKAQRAEAPDDLIAQFETVREFFEAFGIAAYDAPGFEADDVIGTLVRRARESDGALKIIIASGDLDILQLVEGNRTVVFTMRKGVSDTVIYDEQAVKDRFGFLPRRLPEFKGLKGDTSDNIKGVPGVGDKTASALVQKFETLEHIYAELSKKERDTAVLKGKLPDTLMRHKDDAFFSRDLARIRTGVPIVFSLADTGWSGAADANRARAFLERVGFASMVNRIAGVSAKSAGENQPSGEKDFFSAAPVFTEAENSAHVSWIMRDDGSIVFAAGKKKAHISRIDIQKSKKEFVRLFHGNAVHIMHRGKDILKALWRHGVENARVDFDTGVAAWVLDPVLRSPDISQLMPGKDCTHMPALADDLKKKLKENSLDHIYTDLELPLLPVLAQMEHTGILLDTRLLAAFSKKLVGVLAAREKRIYKLAGTAFNINSPKQLGEVLFEKLGISSEAVRATGGGARSTRASELVKLRGTHAVIDEILAYREEMKLKTTYADVLPQLADTRTGRVHAEFNQTGTVTGRLSSQNPNMQNIPVRTPLGQEIRRAFVAADGYVFLSCDYSQIELRLAASLSGDDRMIRAFHDGADIHTLTASAVNHVPPEDVTPAMRRAAKAINFGILYGMGAVSLSESLGITRREADAFIREYFTQFPRVKTYLDELKEHAYEHEYVETLFGRRRYFHNMAGAGWRARREQERMAINAPIQGSGADIIKRAMVRIAANFNGAFVQDDLRLLLQVHDELLFEVRISAADKLRTELQHTMETVCELAVPLRVAAKTGMNWQDMS